MAEIAEKDTSWSVTQDPQTRISVLEERIRGMEQARALQATEYERRLDDLNHAHEQARQTLATYLPRDVFEKVEQGWTAWKSKVDIEMALDRGRKASYTAMLAAGVAILAIVMGVVNFVSRINAEGTTIERTIQ